MAICDPYNYYPADIKHITLSHAVVHVGFFRIFYAVLTVGVTTFSDPPLSLGLTPSYLNVFT